MGEFAADTRATAQRTARLQSYFEQHVMTTARQFICSSEHACRASHQGDFYAGQLPHVGTHYELTRNGKPFRIVVVGQEYGTDDPLVDLDQRRAMVVDGSGTKSRFIAEPPLRARNPHMKGCTSLLRLLFGRGLGSDYGDDFLLLNGNAVHRFDCFALVNSLLCSAVMSETGKRGRSTSTMHRNCAGHFRKTLSLLQPNVVVVQGRGVQKWMKAVFSELSNSGDCRILSFTHPSARGVHNWASTIEHPTCATRSRQR